MKSSGESSFWEGQDDARRRWYVYKTNSQVMHLRVQQNKKSEVLLPGRGAPPFGGGPRLLLVEGPVSLFGGGPRQLLVEVPV